MSIHIFNAILDLKPIFYKRYVDDTYAKRNRSKSDTPFDDFNPYHLNIKPTLEQYPKRVLDNEIITENK